MVTVITSSVKSIHMYKMNSLIAVVCFLAAASYAQNSERDAPILSLRSDVNPDGSYISSYETGNGISASESGVVKNIGGDVGQILETSGIFSYTSPEGQKISLQYLANENGFQPQGDHLPTPPPVPEAIQRAVAYILANPPKETPLRP